MLIRYVHTTNLKIYDLWHPSFASKILYTDCSHALRGNDKSVNWKIKDARFILKYLNLC